MAGMLADVGASMLNEDDTRFKGPGSCFVAAIGEENTDPGPDPGMGVL